MAIVGEEDTYLQKPINPQSLREGQIRSEKYSASSVGTAGAQEMHIQREKACIECTCGRVKKKPTDRTIELHAQSGVQGGSSVSISTYAVCRGSRTPKMLRTTDLMAGLSLTVTLGNILHIIFLTANAMN